MRGCTVAWWPGKIPAGTTSDAVTGMFDMLPTFAALGGGKVPTDRKIDGANLWPILAGEPNAKPPHETFYFYRGLRLEGVRHGDWKLRLPDAPAGTNARAATRRANAVVAKDTQPAQPALYNLKADLGEATNVAAAHPEVVARLEALIAMMKDDLGLEGMAAASRALGKVTNAAPMMDHDGKVREELGGGLFGIPSTTKP
jgi:arylsulfatase A-like enzyme